LSRGTDTPAAPLLHTTIGGLHLVAIDARQLELRTAAGFAMPHAHTGPRGSGRIAESDRALAVAAFNGTTPHAGPPVGMVTAGRMLTPAVAGVATVVTDLRGHTRVGNWPAAGELTDSVVWLRQGASTNDNRVRARSALCRTRDGYLTYGWAAAASSAGIERGMRAAGCEQIVQLASGPRSGFAVLSEGGATSTAVADAMPIDAQSFVDPSPNDFFYLVRRDPKPTVLTELPWKPDGGAQPPPNWLPAVHSADVELLGSKVTLYAFAPGRFDWRIAAGRKEKAGRTATAGLEAAELARASVAISLGIGFRKRNRRGLVLDGVVKLPIRPDLGVLHTDGDALHIARAPDDMAPFGYASELVLLVEAGELRSEARKLSALRDRSAACSLSDGTLLVAVAKFDSPEPLATVLRDAGCRRVVELNRGKQVRAFIHRAGKEDAPQGRYDDTVLYGMARYAGGGVTPLGSP
jgi:hypothetical protein